MATKNKFFVHVGAGKTGTSAIQSFLFNNKSLIAKQGMNIPLEGDVKNKQRIAHHLLAAHLRSTNEALDIWRSIASHKLPICLVSSEFLHSRMSANNGKEFFTRIREILKEYDVEIIFYIRRHSQWLQSAYSQWVKVESESRPFEDFVKHHQSNSADQIMAFCDVFGKDRVKVRVYEKSSFIGGDIFHDFVDSLCLSWDSNFILPEANQNPRLSIDALELKRISNKYHGGKLPAGYLADLLQYSKTVDLDVETIHHDHTIMNPALQLSIEKEMDAKYEWIARELLGREDGKLFLEKLAVRDESFGKAESYHIGMTETDLSQALLFQNLRLYERLNSLSKILNEEK